VARRRGKDSQDGKGSLVELVVIVAVALGLALAIQAFLVKPFRIPSESMEPTLAVGERVLVDRVSPRFSEPERGDVVVFKPPQGSEEDVCGSTDIDPDQACDKPTKARSDTNFIKRVVGIPGDRLHVIKGRVYINGKLQDEPYITPSENCDICNLPKPIRVPPGHFFMMGDNRGNSDDSRKWGPVPEKWVIGGAFFTYWPPKRVGPL
jgi:signal peptidase I